MKCRLRFNIQHFLQKPLTHDTLAETFLDAASPALQLEQTRTRRTASDFDQNMVEDGRYSREELLQDLKNIMGVFSTSKPVDIGHDATTSRIRVKEYWYVVRDGDNFTAQAINSVHVPSGAKIPVSKAELLSSYNPELDYMYTKLLPALRELRTTLDTGDRHRSRMEHANAEVEYNESLWIDTENVRATFGMGLTYLELQDAKKADAVFKSLINLDKAFDEEHKHLFNEFGIQLRKNNMFEHAVQYYERALELSKEDENLFFNLARAWYEKGDWTNCLRNLVICLTMNKQLEEAQRFCKHVLMLSLSKELCKAANKPPLPSSNPRYAAMLEDLRRAAGVSGPDWEALRAEVAADKKKQKKNADKTLPAKRPEPRSKKQADKKKDSENTPSAASGKYIMPF